jgi:hypothetical protein
MRFSRAVAALAVMFWACGARAEEEGVERARARLEMDAAVAGMRGRAKWVRDRLREARRRGASPATAAEVACLDEALSRSDVAVRRAREHEDVALAAYDRGDLDAARAERAQLAAQNLAQAAVARDALTCRR